MPATLEEKVTQCLVAANLTMPQLAEKVGLSEPALAVLCQHNDLRCFGIWLAHCLGVPPAYFLGPVTQAGAFNQAASATPIRLSISKAAAHELAAQLSICQHAFHSINQLLEAKEEIISLLRGGYNRPN